MQNTSLTRETLLETLLTTYVDFENTQQWQGKRGKDFRQLRYNYRYSSWLIEKENIAISANDRYGSSKYGSITEKEIIVVWLDIITKFYTWLSLHSWGVRMWEINGRSIIGNTIIDLYILLIPDQYRKKKLLWPAWICCQVTIYDFPCEVETWK